MSSVCFSKPGSAQDDVTGRLTATLMVAVVNGTPGGRSTVGDPVTVEIYKNEKLIDTLKSRVNEESNVIFEGLPLGETLLVVASCNHDKVVFQGHPVAMKASKTSVTTRVSVYDVSPDDSKLSVTTHHIIIKHRENYLFVSEYMRIKNSSHMAIRSDKRDNNNKPIALKIMLPSGYKNFQSLRYFFADALVFTDEGFYDTMAIAPGEYDVQFSYTLDIDAETMDFSKKVSLPTDSLIVLIAMPYVEAKGLGPSSEFTMANGKSSEYYPMGSLKRGEKVRFQLAGFELPKPDRSWIIIAIVFGLIAVLVMRRLLRK